MKTTEREIALICRLRDNWTAKNITATKMGGKTNRNFRVQDNEGDWFVRIPYEGVEIVDRAVEAQNLQALKECEKLQSLVPVCYVYILGNSNVFSPSRSKAINLPDGTAVIQYLEGRELNIELLHKEEAQDALVNTLHRFHTSGVCFTNEYMPLRDEAEPYKKQAQHKPFFELLPSNSVLEEILKVEKIVESYLLKNCSRDRLSTHNDLNFGNLWLVKNGTIKLLDWEYAGLNICGGLYYDFGTLLGENFIRREGREPISTEIFNQILKKAATIYGQELEVEKVYYCALANVLVTFWWAIMQYFNVPQKEKASYALLVPERISELRRIFSFV